MGLPPPLTASLFLRFSVTFLLLIVGTEYIHTPDEDFTHKNKSTDIVTLLKRKSFFFSMDKGLHSSYEYCHSKNTIISEIYIYILLKICTIMSLTILR